MLVPGYAAGFYGHATPAWVTSAQTGPQGPLLTWAGNTAYGTVGQLVQNGVSVYALVTAGTSAASGGPTGSGSNIQDGTAYWRSTGSIGADLYYTVSFAEGNIGSYNVGGDVQRPARPYFRKQFGCYPDLPWISAELRHILQ